MSCSCVEKIFLMFPENNGNQNVKTFCLKCIVLLEGINEQLFMLEEMN